METIEFRRTLDDLFAFNVFLSERLGHARRSTLSGAAVGFVFVAGVAWWRYRDSGETVLAPVLLGVAIAYATVWLLWLGPRRHRRCLWKTVNKLYGKSPETSHKVALTEEGVQESSTGGNTFHSWRGIPEIARTDSHLFLFVGPASAHIVPVSAFPSRTDADAFYSAAQARIAGSQESVSGST